MLRRFHVLTILAAVFFFTESLSISADTRQLALCVGVETYDPSVFAPLRYSEDDAQALAKTLTDLGYDVLLMTPGAENPRHKPNLPQKIIAQLKTRAAGLTKADSLIVTLSGHGVQFKDDPVGPEGIKDSYFCPQDAALDDRTTLLNLREVYKLVAESGAGRKLVIVDACRNEVLSEKAKGREIELDPAGLTPRAVPEGMLALFSCASQEKSFEDGDLGHGVFTYHILEYLRGEAEPNKYANQQATLDGLVFHAKGLTQSYVQKHLGRAQQPELVGRSTDWSLGKVDIGKVGPVAVIRRQRLPNRVEFLNESQLVVADTDDKHSGEVCLLDIYEQRELRRVSVQKSIRALAVKSPLVLIGTKINDGAVVLWNVQSGETKHTFRPTKVSSVAGLWLAADGKSALSTSLAETPIATLDLIAGSVIHKLEPSQFLGGAFQPANLMTIYQARFSRDGSAVLVDIYSEKERRGVVRLASTQSGRELQRFQSRCSDLKSIDFSPDGRLAAEAGLGGGVVWECSTASEKRTWKTDSTVVRFSPDGNRVAIAHGKGRWNDGPTKVEPDAPCPIVLLDVRSGHELARFDGHIQFVADLAFSPSGRYLASCGNDATARVWRLPR